MDLLTPFVAPSFRLAREHLERARLVEVHRLLELRRLNPGVDLGGPALRRKLPPTASTDIVAGPAPTATLNRYQAEALRLAAAGGGVRREDVIERCGISRESARRALASLVELRLLRRLGSGQGAWYILRTPEEPGG